MQKSTRTFGTSKGCRQCRAKRKKCDLRDPCGRCAVSKTSCSGPVAGVFLVNRYPRNFTKHSQRALLQEALTERRYRRESDSATRLEASLTNSGSPRHIATVFDTRLDRYSIKQLYACMLEDFHPGSSSSQGDHGNSRGIFSHSAIMLCLKLVAGLGSASRPTPDCLDVGVFSLLSLYHGKTCPQHHRLIDLGRRSYSLAIQALQRVLSVWHVTGRSYGAQKRSHQNYELTAFHLSLILVLFELVDAPQANAALDMHIDGALNILYQIGPKGFANSDVQRRLFLGFRSIAYASTVRRRSNLFLDEPEWLAAFSNGEQNDHLKQLYDIAVHLPRLLNRTNDLISSRTSPLLAGDSGLLLDYTVLKSMLQNWYLQQIFCDETSPPDERNLSPKHPTRLKARFENMPHFMTMLVELDMGFNDLVSSTRHYSHLGNVHEMYKEFEILDTKELLVTMTDTIQSLCDSSQGQLVTAIPLDTLKRYRAKQCERRQGHELSPMG